MKMKISSDAWKSVYMDESGNIQLNTFDVEKEEKSSPFPLSGELAKFFKKNAPDDKLTFTISAEEFLGLITPEKSSTSQYLSYNGSGNIWWADSALSMNAFDVYETNRVANNDVLAILIKSYMSGKVSNDLEHKLIWLYPPFAEALGLDNISYSGKILYLTRRPGGIRYFPSSTTEMQMIAINSSWDLIRVIKRPHRDALNEAAKKATIYYERKAEEFRKWRPGELSEYNTKDLKTDYMFFNKYKFDPIIKQDLLGTIMSIFLEHEMTPFI